MGAPSRLALPRLDLASEPIKSFVQSAPCRRHCCLHVPFSSGRLIQFKAVANLYSTKGTREILLVR